MSSIDCKIHKIKTAIGRKKAELASLEAELHKYEKMRLGLRSPHLKVGFVECGQGLLVRPSNPSFKDNW